MTTIGIGTDIISTARIKKAIERTPGFAERILRPAEKKYCLEQKKSYASVAARFAAKEAVAKALGTGFRGFGFQDIEIRNDHSGKPEVYLYHQADTIYRELGGQQILLSVSHCKEYAVAFVIIQGVK